MIRFIQLLIMGILLVGSLLGLTIIEFQPDAFWQGAAVLSLSFSSLCIFAHRIGLLSLSPYLSSSLRQDS